MTVYVSATPNDLDVIMEILTEELRPQSIILRANKDVHAIVQAMRTDFMDGTSDLWSAMRTHAVEFTPSAQLVALIIRLPGGLGSTTRDELRQILIAALTGVTRNANLAMACVTLFDDLIDSLYYAPRVAQDICVCTASYLDSNVGNEQSDVILAIETLTGHACRTVMERHIVSLTHALHNPDEELPAPSSDFFVDLTDLQRIPYRLDLRRLLPPDTYLTPSAAIALQDFLRHLLHDLCERGDQETSAITRLTALPFGIQEHVRPKILHLITRGDGVVTTMPWTHSLVTPSE